MPSMHVIYYFLGSIMLFHCVGCSGQRSRVSPPDVDAHVAAEQAVETYDVNDDDSLARKELESCPALLASFEIMDVNTDGLLSEDEIESRVTTWLESNIGMLSWTLVVTLDGKPLPDATVSLVPVEFLHDAVLPASGVTSDRGIVKLSVADEQRPAPNIAVLQSGFYRLKVSKQDANGETIPDKYNTKTILGVEVSPDRKGDKAIVELRSG